MFILVIISVIVLVIICTSGHVHVGDNIGDQAFVSDYLGDRVSERVEC